MQQLIDELNALCDEQPYPTGWYLKDLQTGQVAGDRTDEPSREEGGERRRFRGRHAP